MTVTCVVYGRTGAGKVVKILGEDLGDSAVNKIDTSPEPRPDFRYFGYRWSAEGKSAISKVPFDKVMNNNDPTGFRINEDLACLQDFAESIGVLHQSLGEPEPIFQRPDLPRSDLQ